MTTLLTINKKLCYSTRDARIVLQSSLAKKGLAIKISLKTIWWWCKSGMIPYLKFGRSLFIEKETIDALAVLIETPIRTAKTPQSVRIKNYFREKK